MSRLGRLIRRNAVTYGGGGTTPVDPVEPGAFKLWSDPSAWVPGSTDSADVPQAGESFEIGADSVIKLDVQTPALGNVMCYGTVIVSNDVDTSIDYHSWMWMPGSKLIFGDGVAGHYLRKFTLRPRGTITGSTPRMVTATTGATPVQMGQNNTGSDRSMMFEDGAEVLGGPPALDHHWRLADHAQQGTNFIKVRGTANVKQGDKFVIGTTDYYGQSGNSEMTVAADSTGDTITFTTNLPRSHWGKLQWVTKTAPRVGHLSLVDEGWRPANDAPYTFDESAHVIRLNRPIVIDGSMDGALGGRFMIHGNSGTINIDGWEFAGMGVLGTQQWYGGVHHHMTSYEMPDGPNSPSNGNYVGGSLQSSLCSGHFVRNCSVHHSKNRGHVPHGSNGVTYDHNVFFDVVASSMFFEEGASRKCTVNECHSILTRPSVAPYVLQAFDEDSDNLTSVLARASAFWLTNPDNTITNNSAGDCVTGFWNAFTNVNLDMAAAAAPLPNTNYNGYGCFGLSKNVPFAPGGLDILLWDNNECYANSKKGILTDFAQSDEAGNVQSDQYPYAGSPADANLQTLSRIKIWKAIQGYQNRVRLVQYKNASHADVCGSFANGATLSHSTAPNGLGICQSLNVTPRPTGLGIATYDAVAMSYNGSLVFPGWVIHGFTNNGVGYDDESGGNNGVNALTARSAFKMWSEYLYPVTGWTHRIPGIELLNSDFAWRTPPDWMIYEAPYNKVRTARYDGDLAGSAKMYDDYLGDGTAGKTWTYDTPFCVYGATGRVDPLPQGTLNGVLINEAIFGIGDSYEGVRQYDGISYDALTDVRGKRDTRRLDPSTLAEVGHWIAPAGPTPSGGTLSTHGIGFQHFPVMQGGVFKSISPDIPQQYWYEIVYGAKAAGTTFVRGVPFTGSKTAKVAAGTSSNDMGGGSDYYASDYAASHNFARRYTTASSLADLISGAANRFWQDKPNNYVWFKFEGGLTPTAQAAEGTDKYDFNETIVVVSAVTTP
jgi:hypothetical protein